MFPDRRGNSGLEGRGKARRPSVRPINHVSCEHRHLTDPETGIEFFRVTAEVSKEPAGLPPGDYLIPNVSAFDACRTLIMVGSHRPFARNESGFPQRGLCPEIRPTCKTLLTPVPHCPGEPIGHLAIAQEARRARSINPRVQRAIHVATSRGPLVRIEVKPVRIP